MTSERFLWGLGVAGASLGIMGCFGVLAFHFPEYLTTPMLREIYQEHQVRSLLKIGLITGLIFSLINIVFSSTKIPGVIGLLALSLAVAMGGSGVAFQSPVPRGSPFLSLDWVLLDLLLLSMIFVPMERIWKGNLQQKINRPGWRTDLTHYVVNHLLMGALVIVIYFPATYLLSQFQNLPVQSFTAELPLVVQLPLVFLVAEVAQYWIHRLSHEIPFLWRFHRVHHSSRSLDWLAGSRLHLVDVILTRTFTMTPVMLLGFSSEAVNLWLPILAFQSVFIHTNVRWKMIPIGKFLSTPLFHHWHHADEAEATNKNYSISLTFVDRIFGTYYCPDRWPKGYGLQGEELEDDYLKHLLQPLS